MLQAAQQALADRRITYSNGDIYEVNWFVKMRHIGIRISLRRYAPDRARIVCSSPLVQCASVCSTVESTPRCICSLVSKLGAVCMLYDGFVCRIIKSSKDLSKASLIASPLTHHIESRFHAALPMHQSSSTVNASQEVAGTGSRCHDCQGPMSKVT